MPEQISSWTVNLNVAKSFRGGVPNDDNFLGVIIRRRPEPGEILLNVHDLVRSERFFVSLAHFGAESFQKGILRYAYSQSEVILEVEAFDLHHDIISLGGHIGSLEQLAEEARQQTGVLPHLDDLERDMSSLGFAPGDQRWLSEPGTRKVIPRILHRASARNLFSAL
ncbi:MAG: hypothetical protein KDD69_10640 [Bdellovibrionales bacterium]|nr:hypothetical protein [Bdellovibrionales bacterium]